MVLDNIKNVEIGKNQDFRDLMKFHVQEILLVSSLYDAFILEEDGRLSHRIFGNFMDLDLHYIPRITQVSSAKEALESLSRQHYDLVITMPRLSDMSPLDFGAKAKKLIKGIPVILLTYAPVKTELLIKIRKRKSIDKIFYWYGDAQIFLAIIKFIEDKLNFKNDIEYGIHAIIVVEDSPWFYSFFLPIVYSEILKQTRNIIADGLTDEHRLMKIKARPKILAAETYDEAIQLYEKNKNNILGIISDISYPKKGKINDNSGFLLAEKIKSSNPNLPFLLQSSEEKNREKAKKLGVSFLNKTSNEMLHDLRKFILNNFGFGDFIFRMPNRKKIGRAKDLEEFTHMIRNIPLESIKYHGSKNHFSTWLVARTEFDLAQSFKSKNISDFENMEALRFYIYSMLRSTIHKQSAGIISDFGTSSIKEDIAFSRLGTGSLGGKARGIAFINALIAKNELNEKISGVDIKIPFSFVICTDVFQEFLMKNDLLEKILKIDDDEEIIKIFEEATLPKPIRKNIKTLLRKINFPLAVRSSSLLEDSQALPFSGIYKTFMVTNNHPNIDVRCNQLYVAIKKVYSSIFLKSVKQYLSNTNFRIEEEKMAVLIQQIAGEKHGNLFYPLISGAAYSYNFYPLSHMKAESGVFSLALGLGRIMEESNWPYRFSPDAPEINPLFRQPEKLYRKSQKSFYAVDLNNNEQSHTLDESTNQVKCRLSQAQDDEVLDFVASVLTEDGVLQEKSYFGGKPVITFTNILRNKYFNFTFLIRQLLKIGHYALGTPVEIEFTINLKKGKTPEFYFLQIRPLISGSEFGEISIENVKPDKLVLKSENTMGNGVYDYLTNIILVDPETFSNEKTVGIAQEIAIQNQIFKEKKDNYILIGYGRWGTSDNKQGIPVSAPNISEARLLVESNLNDFKTDPSKGNHLFQWMLNSNVGYMFVDNNNENSFINWNWLNNLPFERPSPNLKIIKLSKPIIVKIDGRFSKGAILKPKI